MYAVLATGGKQYRVSPGDTIRVEKLDAEPGELVELTDVRLVSNEAELLIGTPRVPNARVVGLVLQHGLARKILVFKKKRRKQYRRTQGHRQSYTALRIERIA